MDVREGIRHSGGLSMAGSTANPALLYPSMGFPRVEMNGLGYIGGQVMLFEDIVGPTESNRSDAYIGNIMSDPRESPSLEQFLDAEGFGKMPCRERITIEVKVNSISRGFPTFPYFED